MSKGLIWQNHPKEVIDVVYDTIYGYTIDEAMEILNQHRQGKFIHVEWIKEWLTKQTIPALHTCDDYDAVNMMLDDWEKENE